jgi:hypothetical protein
MTTTADTYRHYAEECLRWAEETDNEEHRQAFLDMAVAWMKLIGHTDHQTGSGVPNGGLYQPRDNARIG